MSSSQNFLLRLPYRTHKRMALTLQTNARLL